MQTIQVIVLTLIVKTIIEFHLFGSYILTNLQQGLTLAR